MYAGEEQRMAQGGTFDCYHLSDSLIEFKARHVARINNVQTMLFAGRAVPAPLGPSPFNIAAVSKLSDEVS